MSAPVKSRFAVPDEELETLLHRYTRDITAIDRESGTDPISGRDPELDQMVLILMQRMRKNVLLLGAAGTGKTALFYGLAQRVNQNRVPKMLQGARIIELDMSMIGAGSQSRADLEGRLIPIIKGIAERNAKRTAPPVIFCIDEVHQLMLAFKASSYSGIADILKPYLTAGSIYMIASTTRDEYQDFIQPEPAIDRRFQKLMLATPDLEMTQTILTNLKGRFEEHYGIVIPPDTFERIVRLADRYIPKRTNPDKSILALDQACARAVVKGNTDTLDSASVEAAIAAEAGIDPKAVR